MRSSQALFTVGGLLVAFAVPPALCAQAASPQLSSTLTVPMAGIRPSLARAFGAQTPGGLLVAGGSTRVAAALRPLVQPGSATATAVDCGMGRNADPTLDRKMPRRPDSSVRFAARTIDVPACVGGK